MDFEGSRGDFEWWVNMKYPLMRITEVSLVDFVPRILY